MPLPNWHVIGPDIAYYSNHSVVGIYEEGAYRGPGGDMAALKAYLISRMLWDPTLDPEKEIDEFLVHYYQNASSFVRLYMDLVTGAVQGRVCQGGADQDDCIDVRCASALYPSWFEAPVIVESARLIAEGMAAVRGSGRYLYRTEQLLISVYLPLLFRWAEVSALPQARGVIEPTKEQAWERFAALSRRMRIKNFREVPDIYNLSWVHSQVFKKA